MIRAMELSDFEEVHALWMSIHGFGIRSIDDSKESIEAFIRRNPTTSAVDIEDGHVVGAILCGHDGRRACLYHVCVSESYRRHGIGKKMVDYCLEGLKEQHINKVFLNAFITNKVGNEFWTRLGWNNRSDMNYYDLSLNDDNLTIFNK